MSKDVPEALPAAQLRRQIDTAAMTTALEQPRTTTTAEPFGHARARDAIDLALALPMAGGHLYVMGSRGVGRRAVLESALRDAAADRPPGSDLCYVSDFREPRCPKALHLAPCLLYTSDAADDYLTV